MTPKDRMEKVFDECSNGNDIPDWVYIPDSRTAKILSDHYGVKIRPGIVWAKEKAMIRKTKSGYKVVSEGGKNLGGPYKSKAAAEKRLRQVEYFKHRKGK